jgi:arylsulfatase A-like enzyme
VTTGIGSELDIVQTFAALSGAAVPSGRVLDGYDLSQTLRGKSPSPRHTLFYYANAAGGALSAVRHDAFKAHFIVPDAGPATPAAAANTAGATAAAAERPIELYDLDQDPSEKYDLASRRPDVIAELRRLADEHRKTIVPVKNQIATRTQGRGSRP